MKFTLNIRDLLKGLLMAILVPVLYIIQSSIAAGEMTFNWKQIAFAALGGGVAYILKNFFTDDISAAKKTIADARDKGLNV